MVIYVSPENSLAERIFFRKDLILKKFRSERFRCSFLLRSYILMDSQKGALNAEFISALF